MIDPIVPPQPSRAPLLLASAVSGLVFLILGFLLGSHFPQKTAQITPAPTIIPSIDLSKVEWLTYTNTKYNFSLQYPSDWYYIEVPTPPYETQTEGVWFAPKSSGMPPPYTDAAPPISLTITSTYPPHLNREDFKSYKSQPYQLGNIPAEIISGITLNIENPVLVVVAKIGNDYIQAAPDNQIKQSEDFDRILSTFKFTNQTNTPIGRAQATELVKNQSEVKQWLTLFNTGSQSTPHVVVEDEDAARFTVHVYEGFPDHLATFNWYYVNKTTGEVTKEFN